MFRLKRLEMAEWACDHCGDSKSKLNVHHRYYIAGRHPWEYPRQSTLVLCDTCHWLEHESDLRKPDDCFCLWEYAATIWMQKDIDEKREQIGSTKDVR